MKSKIKFRLLRLNSFDISILEKLQSKTKARFSRHDITQHLETIGYESITHQYFSMEMKKLVDLGLILEEGEKPKTYALNPIHSENILYYIVSFQRLEHDLCENKK